MNPTAYSQPTISGLVRVAHSFGLDILSITSVHLFSMFVPHCKTFFCFACEIVIYNENRIVNDIIHNAEGRTQLTEMQKNFPVLQLGCCIAFIAKKLMNNADHAPVKYCDYGNTPEVPNCSDWCFLCEQHLKITLLSWKVPTAKNNSNAKAIQAFYDKIFTAFNVVCKKQAMIYSRDWAHLHAKICFWRRLCSGLYHQFLQEQ